VTNMDTLTYQWTVPSGADPATDLQLAVTHYD